jgi:hypothetical protein
LRHKVKTLNNCGTQCPTQWEGRTIDGKYIYIRFRGGRFRASVADTEWGAVRGNGDNHFWVDESEPFAGDMSDKEMRLHCAGFLDFSDVTITKEG